MTKPIALVAILTATAVASGCSTLQRSMGMGKITPDEFRVVTSAPLTLPPEYSLRPPRPGEPRPQELEPSAEARSALFGQDVGSDSTPGERTLVENAGATAVDANIRDTVDYEGQGVVRRNEQFADRVNEYGRSTEDVDEARRLEEEEAIRRATGGGDVTIRRGGGGIKLPGT
jgi:hypothetical protein